MERPERTQTDQQLLLLPVVRPGDGALDEWLGDSLTRTLRRRLKASGREVVPVDAARQACRSLGIELFEEPLPPTEREWLSAQTGSTHLIQGTFDRREGELTLTLWLLVGEERPVEVVARGPEADFQEVIDDALVRLIQHVPGPRGEQVRKALRQARATESLDAFLAVVRARAAWDAGDLQAFEEEVAAAVRLDPDYVEPHEVVAGVARMSGETERVVEALQEVARIHGETGRVHEQATTLLQVGHALVEQGDWDEGVEAYEEAARRFEAEGEVRGWVQARMDVANVHLRQGDHDQAIAEYTEGLERVRGFPRDYAEHVFNLGLALKGAGDLDEAVERLEEARRLGIELRDDALIASAFNALGAVYDDMGDPERAISLYRRAEEHLDAETDPLLLAKVKDNIGIILKQQGELERALEYSEQACQLLESRGDPLHVAIAFVNRGGLLLELDREDEAAPFVVAAHREFVRLGSPSQATTEAMLRDDLELDDEAIDAIEAEAEESLDDLEDSTFDDDDLDDDEDDFGSSHDLDDDFEGSDEDLDDESLDDSEEDLDELEVEDD